MNRPCRYSLSSLRPDYVRAAVGAVLTGGPLVTLSETGIADVILSILLALFALFGARTMWRHLSVFELDDRALVRRGLAGGRVGRTQLAWNDLSGLKLSFYSTRRDRSQGWMQLRLRAGRARLALDSTLDGFDEIAARAGRAARAKGLVLSPTTVGNFSALGIELDPGDPAQGASL